MDIVYHLSTCDTCRKILASLPKNDLMLHDIKKQPLTESDVDRMKELAGSYEALFSRKAQLYKSRGLKDQKLSEADYRKLILEHYTFLSRPVFIIDNKIYVGNSAHNVEKVIGALK
ncbi:arsenate reductase family protein [Flavobacterium selenitireducens]|uniref:arsenate reductase family protein n=1 Tax=Flavobacterium selenitireducens TaxID=2722704 RepID=UPI00168BFA20|nr:ArsC/Spx/MgsR family protein [Flavobacterium selenitireducens]MBD3582067.1 arsenate reductase [Flavobacterium selenitireducens]